MLSVTKAQKQSPDLNKEEIFDPIFAFNSGRLEEGPRLHANLHENLLQLLPHDLSRYEKG